MFSKMMVRRNFGAKVFNKAGTGYEVPTKLIIDGQRVDSVTGKTFDTINPGTEQVIAQVASAQKEDLDIAVESSKKAFEEWKKVSLEQRAQLLNRFADKIEENMDELMTLESEDMGKPAPEAFFDMKFSAATMRYYAGLVTTIGGRTLQRDVGGLGDFCKGFGYTREQPIGVCGLITPWNFPALMTAWKIAPCLAAGSVGISKPPEMAPLTSLRMIEMWNQMEGVVPGTIQCLPGIGAEIGDAIVDHPGIKKVAFTGSGVIGKRIMSRAAPNLKRITLELGGKGPLIVCADSDLERAIETAANMGYLNSGQFCAAPTRLIVEEPVYDEFVEKVAERAKAMKVGYWKEEDVVRGPLVYEQHMQKVLKYIDIAKKEGAECVAGGKRADREGFFVEPTLFANCNNNMQHVREEIFGPVLSVVKFNGIEEALEIANDSEYGLGGGVFSSDMAKIDKVIREMDQGAVNVNSYFQTWTDSPFGGFKQSGIGRELGPDSIKNYLETKTVTFTP